ncbi:hypothetical protein [Sphingorhabdus sp.]|uniref:hypothetical protein n=1 Tax=Sphingorhabdus sp. TaxID=1902408 RepID=UPI003342CD33
MASSGAVQISHAKGPSASCVTLEAGRPKIIALDAITRQTRVLCGAVTHYGDQVTIHGESTVSYGDVPTDCDILRSPKNKVELHVRTTATVTIY